MDEELEKELEDNPRALKIVKRLRLEKEEGNCARCPTYDGENRERRVRGDRYKDHRRGHRKREYEEN